MSNLYGLTESEMERLDSKGILSLIYTLDSRLENPYLSRFDRAKIKDEISELQELLAIAKEKEEV